MAGAGLKLKLKFTIDRSIWACGNWMRHDMDIALMREDGRMDTLGQILSQCGAPDDVLRGKFHPAQIPEWSPDVLLDGDGMSEFAYELIELTEYRELSLWKRERLLKSHVKEVGWELEFVGELY